ncbi:MAG: hypothetical protein Q8P80_00855 [Candidatus Levybacteria bacterium]|nr:hypothetical protein [Candidatus Levybacteria bacterium]
MSQAGETFFTSVGCMDGRVQEVVAKLGREKFQALYGDTITEAGLVGLLGKEKQDPNFINSLKNKIFISLEKHHSKGIIVHGHQDCAGNPVDDQKHKEDISKSVELIRGMVGSQLPVLAVFVKREGENWVVEELQ